MRRLRLLLWLLCLGFAFPVRAQVVPNGLGTQVTVNGQQFDIGGGTRAGANLFHSFAQFGLSQAQIANFLSNPAIRNILARVTGGDVSVINGLIKVTGGNSNLYLMNPAGIVFGPNASLNVPAAFHATTANAIKIGNGYFGMNTTAAELATLTAEPNGYLFSSLNQNLNPGTPAGVIVNQANLSVNPGQTIVLAGNQVINTGTIQSPNGTIIITATADGKYVNVSQSGSILSLDLPVAVNQNIAVQNLRPVLPTDIPQLLTGTAYVSGTVSTASAVRNPDSLINITGERVILDRANLDNLGTDGLIQIRVAPGIANEGYVFLDRVRNYEQLVNALVPGSELYLINRTDSGVEKVNQVIAKNGAVQRIDIVGDGNAGQIWFGRDFITLDRLPQYEAQIAQWGQGLTGNREIFLYACNLAASQAGIELAGEIGRLTSSTVAASTDVTGSSQYGGNWQFEYSTGNISGQIAFDAQAVQSADVKLATFTVLNTNDSGAGSLRQAVNDANVGMGADNIAFAPATNGTPIVLTTGELVVTDSDGLTITGNGATNTIIDGNNTSRGFNVAAGDITFDGVTIRNGNANVGGGIFSNGTVTLTNSTVSGNTAGVAGGGIKAGTVTLTNSTVSGNKAASNDGGGIFASGTVTLTNSTVLGNRADVFGGGIRAVGTVTLTNSTVSDNTANKFGGGIFASGTVTLTNSTVSDNTAASNDGGGIWAVGTVSLTNSTVSGNTANTSGGGIRANGTVTLTNSTVSDNTANSAGGGILANGTVTLTNSTVSGNTANSGFGGGILANGTVTLTNSTVSGNTANNFGGGIFSNDTVTLTNSTVSDNTATSQDGGGIWAFGTVSLTNSTVSGNTASIDDGGGILAFGTVTLSDNSTVSGNTAGNQGGGIWAFGTVTLSDNSTVSGNTAGNQGGGIWTNGTVTLSDNSTVSNNTANKFGGGIFANTVTLTNSTMSNNTAGFDGGGIFATGAVVTLTNSTVSNNTAGNSGGGILAFGTVTLTDNSTVSGNTANSSGGGILAFGTVTLTNSTVSDNTATSNDGGGILAFGTVTLTNSTMSGNTAGVDGGGIRAGAVTLTNSTVSGNTANSSGGGILADGDVTLTNSTVSGNTANFGTGGGIRANGNVTLTNSTVSDNKAINGSGGGILANTVTLTDSTVSGNTATFNGGGILANTVTLTDSTVSGNTAGVAGGGIRAFGTVTLTNATISGNKANNSGGGIFANNGATIRNSTIAFNTANNGGGIFVFSGTIDIGNSIVAKNTATTISPDIGSESVGKGYTNAGNNLIGINTGFETTFATGALIGTASTPVDPLLAPLANNGGVTQTHALLPGSPAINAGNNALIPMGVTEDQRGAGFPRIMFTTVDIGAFEVQAISPVVPPPASITFVPVAVLSFTNQLNIILRGTEDVIFSQFLPCAPNQNFEQCLDDATVTTREMILQIE